MESVFRQSGDAHQDFTFDKLMTRQAPVNTAGVPGQSHSTVGLAGSHKQTTTRICCRQRNKKHTCSHTFGRFVHTQTPVQLTETEIFRNVLQSEDFGYCVSVQTGKTEAVRMLLLVHFNAVHLLCGALIFRHGQCCPKLCTAILYYFSLVFCYDKLQTNGRDSKGDIKCATMPRRMLASQPGNTNTPIALRHICRLLRVYHFTLNFWTFLIVNIAHFLILLSVNTLCTLVHSELSNIQYTSIQFGTPLLISVHSVMLLLTLQVNIVVLFSQ